MNAGLLPDAMLICNCMSDDALAAVKAAGIQVIYPDKQPFRDAVADFHQSLKQTDIGPLLQQIAEIGAKQEASDD